MKIKSPSQLNLLNFAALYDTARSISSELDILPKEKVYIDAIAKNLDASLALVFTQQAFSDKTLGDLRYKALQYLQECRQITSFEYRDDALRERVVEISLDPEHFIGFFSELEKIYDNRWKDYENIGNVRQKNNNILFNLKEEEETVNKINSGTQHKSFRDKWLNIKRVFDVINDEIFPDPVNPIGEIDPQNIIIEKVNFFEKNIPEKKGDIIYNTLKLLEANNIIKINKPNNEDEIYIRLDPKGIFFNNRTEIIIQNKKLFEKHLRDVSAFLNYIEEDGQKRFPSEYGTKTDSENLIQNQNIKSKEDTQKKLLEAYLDEKRKIFVTITPSGTEEFGFKKKKIAKEDPRYARRQEALDEVENDKSETKFYKAFATLFDMRKEVEKFQEKENFAQGQSIEGLAEILKTNQKSVRNYIARIRELISKNRLPIKLETDYRGNYQMIIRITRKLNTK
jgi:hypothetical protein